jgi:N-acetylmuramoyl-L-alanine amidase
MRNTLPCVGLVVLVGSFTFIMAPDDDSEAPRRRAPGSQALPTVVIDPGHGGRDEGARGNGLIEKTLTLDLAERVNKGLQTFGFHTVMTRTDDTYVGLPERAAIGNRCDDALFVSLHFNQNSSTAASGIETFYESQKIPPETAWAWIGFFNKPDTSQCESGETLAGYVQTSLALRTEAVNRGIKARDLYVVRHVRGPSVLVEAGFLSNPVESRLLSNFGYRDRLATAVVEGVMSYVKARSNPPAPGPLVKLEP